MCNYGVKLIGGTMKKSFSCFDMTMTIIPAMVLTLGTLVVNGSALLAGLITGVSIDPIIGAFVMALIGMYSTMFLVGIITTITEWNQIYTTTWKKILYTFTFPVFMITYIPITVMAIFKKVEWKPIAHTKAKDLADIIGGSR